MNPIAFEQALGSLRRGGTLVCVGLPADNAMKLPIFETVLGGLTVRGSIVGTAHDLEEVFELHRRGLTTVFRSSDRARRRQRGDRAGARRHRAEPAARLPHRPDDRDSAEPPHDGHLRRLSPRHRERGGPAAGGRRSSRPADRPASVPVRRSRSRRATVPQRAGRPRLARTPDPIAGRQPHPRRVVARKRPAARRRWHHAALRIPSSHVLVPLLVTRHHSGLPEGVVSDSDLLRFLAR